MDALSAADILSLNTPGPALPVLDKITAGSSALNAGISHVIPKEMYNDIYATSDIHADLRKLHYLLTKAGLISDNGLDKIMDIMAGVAAGGSINWLASKTLFVIVGDLIDGSRDGSNIDDDVGNIEVLLHAYIYNLRIKARALGSEIRFTIGNHDWHTVIKPYESKDDNLYRTYVHDAAKNFFGQQTKHISVVYAARRTWLLPFYNACPYIFLNVDNEVAFVHGGLHGGKYNIEEIRRCQDTINSNAANTKFDTAISADNKVQYLSSESGPLWTRFYAEKPAAVVCAALDKNKDYKMIVVGHCQTEPGSFKHYDAILQEPEYTACKCGGLVLLGCRDAGNGAAPRLAFVDIGMSCCFRADKEWAAETGRRAEFLHLQHDSTKSDANRWYNIVKREVISGQPSRESIVAWSELAPALGNRKGGYRSRCGSSRSSRNNRTKAKRQRRRCRRTAKSR